MIKHVQRQCCSTCLSAGVNTTILLVNWRENRKHFLVSGNLLSSCLAVFSRATTSSCHLAPCGLWGKNRPTPFPVWMLYKVTKPGLVLFYILACFNCIVAYYGPFLYIVYFSWYVFCLLVVLVKLSLLAKWLTRITPLRKSNHGEGINSIEPRPKQLMIMLVYCILSLFCCMIFVFSPGPMWYISYFYGMIEPICAESAVKTPTNSCHLLYAVFSFLQSV